MTHGLQTPGYLGNTSELKLYTLSNMLIAMTHFQVCTTLFNYTSNINKNKDLSEIKCHVAPQLPQILFSFVISYLKINGRQSNKPAVPTKRLTVQHHSHLLNHEIQQSLPLHGWKCHITHISYESHA